MSVRLDFMEIRKHENKWALFTLVAQDCIV